MCYYRFNDMNIFMPSFVAVTIFYKLILVRSTCNAQSGGLFLLRVETSASEMV